MEKTEIRDRNDPVLREQAKSVAKKNIGSKELVDIIDRMRQALEREEDGVAIAAPQIGESLRIFIVSPRVPAAGNNLVFVNPEIIKISRKKREMDEGCLSVRWLYGKVRRSEKVIIRAQDEQGKIFKRGASGLLAQICQHEIDHLDGILFTDKAKNVKEIIPEKSLRFVFFGNSSFSHHVLKKLKENGFTPSMTILDAKEPLPTEELRALDADLFIVASFGKILPKEILDIPKYGSINIHPSLLPKLRGPSPIQNLILGQGKPGVTIIKMDEKIDHGPIIAQETVKVIPLLDHYTQVEEKLGRAGGRLLAKVLSNTEYLTKLVPQNESEATFTKLIRKEDGLLDLSDNPETNLRKVLAYSTWPGAYFFFDNKHRKKIRMVVKDAEVRNGKFTPLRVIPAGKREMDWSSFLRGN